MEIASIIINIAVSIISGMVLFLLQKFFKKRDRIDREKDKRTEKENILILKSINAIGKLTEANAIALRDGKTNGETQAALKEYERVNKELYQYLLEQNAQK